jgi:hypothetical protein
MLASRNALRVLPTTRHDFAEANQLYHIFRSSAAKITHGRLKMSPIGNRCRISTFGASDARIWAGYLCFGIFGKNPKFCVRALTSGYEVASIRIFPMGALCTLPGRYYWAAHKFVTNDSLGGHEWPGYECKVLPGGQRGLLRQF